MSFKKVSYICAYLIIPALLYSGWSWLYSPGRVYIHSIEFMLSIYLGALVTSTFYSQYLSNLILKYIIVFLLGIIEPSLFLLSVKTLFSPLTQEHTRPWELLFLATFIIGCIEIALYLGLFYVTYLKLRKTFLDKLYRFMKII